MKRNNCRQNCKGKPAQENGPGSRRSTASAGSWPAKLGIFLFGLSNIQNSFALNDDELYFADLPMVASVSRLPQKASETPGAVTVIDQEMIRASGFRTVEDLLRLVPGFQVTSHNQAPGLVTYHGLSTGLAAGTTSDEFSSRVQVLIDGRSQFSPLFKSGVNWNLLPVALENIERIEVTRGSNTVSYGSNAVMGVINIITLDASQTRGWMISANHGNNQISDQTIRWGGGTENADIRFTAKQFQDGGFTKAYYSAWFDAPDTRRTGLLDLRADLRLSNSDELRFTLSQTDDVSEYGRPDRTTPPRDPLREMHSRSRSLGLHWQRIISATEELGIRYSFTEDWASMPYSWQYSFRPTGASADVTAIVPYESGGRSRIHELEFEHRLKPFETTRVTWGTAAKSIALRSPDQFTYNDTKERHNFRIFGNLEYKPQAQWVFNLGASAERDSVSGHFFDPRASVSYHLTPEHTLRLVASRAHRTPSLYEAMGYTERWATYNGTPIRDITYFSQGVRPEIIKAVEVGYLAQLKALRASVDVRLFREHIPNRIQIVPLALSASMADGTDSYDGSNPAIRVGTLYPYGRADGAINLENVHIQGYEHQWRWQPFEGTRLIASGALISIDASLTDEYVVADSFPNAQGEGDNIGKISRQTRASAPVRSYSGMLIQRLPYDLQGSVMYFQNDSMRWRRNGGPIQNSKRVDWRIAKTFKLGSTRTELAYTVQMANADQEGRFANDSQIARIAEKLHWLTVRMNF